MAFYIKNVLLETGYIEEKNQIAATSASLFHIYVKDGIFQKIIPAGHPVDVNISSIDANRQLLLPSFGQMHVHLDKTYFSGKWKAVTAVKNRFVRIEEEKELLPKMQSTAHLRAEKMLQHFLANGTTRVRTHCNIEPVSQLENLAITRQVLTEFSGGIAGEIVAFPQHGLLRSNSEKLMREAMRSGATIVGGVDPGTFDGNIENSLYTTMDIAVEADADIDIHLHELGALGIFTIKYLAKLIEEAGWQNRVTISHAYCLGTASLKEVLEIAELLNGSGISLASSVPMRSTIPIPLLAEKGVKIDLGTDNLVDHWSPFGTGAVIEIARKLAERFNLTDEKSLGQTLRYITGGITPLDHNGHRVWPKVGDKADAILVNATCSAEAVALRAKSSMVFYKGNIVFQDQWKENLMQGGVK
ncbi:amidohydrolase [Niallia sp. NCCP-28]|uniref:amidohydrolase n=1 Tax=Niallia sp. NCCP-28 TaxID=2934712 RepID=UPI00208991C3|nr:amidohydrolase [Niallia sp. NCCP-28]GKU85079.1 deaminase [Niallia sp. NCCP-28]